MVVNRMGVTKLLLALVLVALGSGLLVVAQARQDVGSWAAAGVVADSRSGAAAVVLNDGRTLIAGGLVAGTPTDSVVVYDPVTHGITLAGQLLAARVGHTATLLQDGRVLVAGGQVGDALSADIEVFDPVLGSSTLLAQMAQPRTRHAAARIDGGAVVLFGGATVGGAVLNSVERVDASTASVTAAAQPMLTARASASATTLIDGRVLVAGGNDGTADLSSAEIYNAWTQEFEATGTQLSAARSGHTAVLLPHNNGVLIAGGSANGTAQASTDLFLPAEFPDPYSYGTGAFAATGAMANARAGAVGGPAGEGYAWVDGGGSPAAEQYRFATIKTDKDDYAPGEQAVITGSGWQPGEAVRLLFQEDPPVHADYELMVTADAEGNIRHDQWAPEAHDLGVRFYLMASDSRSRAQTTFTDNHANASFRFSTIGLPSGVSITITGQRRNPGNHNLASYSVGFTSPGPSANTGVAADPLPTPPGGLSMVSYTGFQSAITVSGVTYNLVSTSPASGFAAGTDGTLTTVTATYEPANTAPVAANQSVTTNEDTPTTLTLSSSDANGDNQTFAIVTNPTHGTLGSIGSPSCTGTSPKTCTATVTYTPPTDYNGPDSFTFKSNDGTVDSATATVTITVRPVNDAPIAADHTVTTPEDTAVGIDLGALVSDVETSDANLTYVIVGGPSNGGLSGSGSNRTYTPNANFNGTDSFTYRVTDRGDPDNCGPVVPDTCTAALSSDIKTVTITITPVNDVPTADDKTVTTPEETAAGVTLTGSDVETLAANLTFTVTQSPAHGTLSGTAPNLTYTPAVNYNGPDSFKYTVTDRGDPDNCGAPSASCAGSATSAEATVTITVQPVNDAPIAADHTVTTPEDTAVGIDLGALVSDVETSDANLIYTIVSGPSNGGLSGTGSNRTYTPNANFNGTDSFTYKATDRGDPDNCGPVVAGVCTAALDSATKTVTITIAPVNDVPTADNKTVTTPEDIAVGVVLTGNDVETPASSLSFTVMMGPSNGTLTGTAPNLTYTPNANYYGPDSFTYVVTDRGDPDNCTPGPSCAPPATSSAATVAITVTPVNDRPVVAVPTVLPTSINENASVMLSGMFADPDVGDAHTVEINWGDGSVNTVVTLLPGYFSFNVPHTYLDDNPTGTAVDLNAISVTVTDNAATTGGVGPLSGYAGTSVEVKNVNPVVAALSGLPSVPVPIGATVTLGQTGFTDVGTLDTHSCVVNWGDSVTDQSIPASSSGGIGQCGSTTHTYTQSGVFAVTVTVTDDDGGVGTSRFEYIVVFPPDGHVTGGGWINSPLGAYAPDPTLIGKANFGFVSKYKRGQSIPDGQTEFQFKAGNLDFHSTSYEWLVVSGARAQFFGSGLLKDSTQEYWFKLTAIDGQLIGGGGTDKFRIKIWVKLPDGGDGPILYDNQMGQDDNGNATTILGGGSIVLHNPK